MQELGTMSKNNLRRITLGIRPIWGDSVSYLDLLLSLVNSHTLNKKTMKYALDITSVI